VIRRVLLVVAAAAAAILLLGGAALAGDSLLSDEEPFSAEAGPPASVSGAPVALMLQLEGKPAAALPARRESAQAEANAALQANVALEAADEELIESELFRVGVAYNGVAVLASPGDAAALAEIDGVKAVRELPSHETTNSESVPFIGGDDAWTVAGGAFTGDGVKIGVVDTGVDYVHTNFGGPGTVGAYTDARAPAANVTPANPDDPPVPVTSGATQLYPSARVVGGFDFVGDLYTGATDPLDPGSVPAPDSNPLDCATTGGNAAGHGSHVAGSAAGSGVNPDGTTYTGSYSTVDLSDMRIGPGVAPEADIYALRIFGCSGSTSFTTAAIDWAADPNGDGSTADRLDVSTSPWAPTSGSPAIRPPWHSTRPRPPGSYRWSPPGTRGTRPTSWAPRGARRAPSQSPTSTAARISRRSSRVAPAPPMDSRT
jgi:hypothetical protein